MNIYNKTQLTPEKTFERHVFHRDQFAHYLRWSFFLRTIEHGPEVTVVDAGCGSGQLFELLYRNMKRCKYIGLDVRGQTIKQCNEKYKETGYHPVFIEHDLTKPFPVQGHVDYVISFEVLEHVHPTNAMVYLKNMYNIMGNSSILLLSTPNYDPIVGAAKNHIQDGVVCEFTHEQTKKMLEETGFEILNRYGTFASKKDIYKKLSPELQHIYDRVSEYYDSNVMSVLFAPLFPEHSRNCMWVCRRRKLA